MIIIIIINLTECLCSILQSYEIKNYVYVRVLAGTVQNNNDNNDVKRKLKQNIVNFNINHDMRYLYGMWYTAMKSMYTSYMHLLHLSDD